MPHPHTTHGNLPDCHAGSGSHSAGTTAGLPAELRIPAYRRKALACPPPTTATPRFWLGTHHRATTQQRTPAQASWADMARQRAALRQAQIQAQAQAQPIAAADSTTAGTHSAAHGATPDARMHPTAQGRTNARSAARTNARNAPSTTPSAPAGTTASTSADRLPFTPAAMDTRPEPASAFANGRPAASAPHGTACATTQPRHRPAPASLTAQMRRRIAACLQAMRAWLGGSPRTQAHMQPGMQPQAA